MSKCTRKGCGQEFDESKNEEGSCKYHSGAPVFHEGLKSWSCCNDTNKPVLDFESFMKIPGCTTGKHTAEKPKESGLQTATTPSSVPSSSTSTSTTPAPASNVTVTRAADGTETYSSASVTPSLSSTPKPTTTPKPAEPTPPPEMQDDLETPVKVGTICKRYGCGKAFKSQEESRVGDGDDATCVYHSHAPIFHEGSKGYLCCKRRVLDFDDFLKITGCKTGRHVFAEKAKAEVVPGDEFVQCRIDHYQTPSEVHVTVYAKKCDKERSQVRFESEQIHLDLYLPNSKRFVKTINLYGPIEPDSSSFTFFGTKLDLLLVKDGGRSWNLLEKPADPSAIPQGFNLTFGVGGRTGSVGAKELVLDEGNREKAKSPSPMRE